MLSACHYSFLNFSFERSLRVIERLEFLYVLFIWPALQDLVCWDNRKPRRCYAAEGEKAFQPCISLVFHPHVNNGFYIEIILRFSFFQWKGIIILYPRLFIGEARVMIRIFLPTKLKALLEEILGLKNLFCFWHWMLKEKQNRISIGFCLKILIILKCSIPRWFSRKCAKFCSNSSEVSFRLQAHLDPHSHIWKNF